MEFRVWCFVFRLQGFEFRVEGLEFRVPGLGTVQGIGLGKFR